MFHALLPDIPAFANALPQNAIPGRELIMLHRMQNIGLINVFGTQRHASVGESLPGARYPIDAAKPLGASLLQCFSPLHFGSRVR